MNRTPARVAALFAAMLLAAMLLAACSQPQASNSPTSPVTIEEIEGSDAARLTLTERAVERLGIQTAKVESSTVAPATLAIPYAAVIYDPDGSAWAYTNPTSHTYMRARIQVARIIGDVALLTDGPAPGTAVVTVGGAELYGAETGVSGGH